jgi:hypothetical protein
MADAIGEGALMFPEATETIGGAGAGCEGEEMAVSVGRVGVTMALVVVVGRAGELVVVTVLTVLVFGMGINWVTVIGPVKVNGLFCLARGAASGQPWKGRRFLCRTRSAGRRCRFEGIIGKEREGPRQGG